MSYKEITFQVLFIRPIHKTIIKCYKPNLLPNPKGLIALIPTKKTLNTLLDNDLALSQTWI